MIYYFNFGVRHTRPYEIGRSVRRWYKKGSDLKGLGDYTYYSDENLYRIWTDSRTIDLYVI